MLFSSVSFLFLFLPIVLVLYYFAPKTTRNYILLVASLVFYAWGEPVYLLVMLVSTVIAYETGLFISSQKRKQNDKWAKAGVVFSVIVHIGILLYFKYADFFIENANGLFHSNIKLLKLALPLGISFYTFQILSYTVDVYKGAVKVQTNYFYLATYVCLFPQLIAGPIVRYEDVQQELKNRTESVDLFAEGIQRFIVGLAKKVLLANTIGALYSEITALPQDSRSVLLLWIGSFAYTFQIYFDFSGYSDMAIGLGKMFGFHFLENFNYPYISKSVTEFWRRWHISLSSWFRDYIYIPLGGSRCSKAKTIRNIFIVWFLTGFWHGAEWNFIIWGLFFFCLLMFEKLFLLKVLKKVPKFVSWIYTIFFVNISWVIFANDDLHNLKSYLKGMFGMDGLCFINRETVSYAVSYLFLFAILIVASTPLFKRGKRWLLERYRKEDKSAGLFSAIEVIVYICLFLITIAYLVSSSFNPFLYFRF